MATRSLSSLLVGCTLCLAPAFAPAAEEPWNDTWKMELRGEERTYVDYDGTSYLRVGVDEMADHAFVKDKDLALTAKFARLDGDRARFYGLDDLRLLGGAEAWARALDGDNLHLLGHLRIDDGTPVLRIDHVLEARSDAEIVAERLDAVDDDDLSGRLAVARWVRDQAQAQGNSVWWLQTADDIVDATITRAVEQATATRDAERLLQAMRWAIDHGRTELAASLAAQPWVLEGPEALASKSAALMQELGYVLVTSGEEPRWLTEGASLRNEYQRRLKALYWRDAEGFYQLGRWADQHADILPQARQLAHQAFQKGLQADEGHPGIRRELGLDPIATDATDAAGSALDFSSDGFVLAAPRGWDRSAQPVTPDADVTWIDPRSDTAYIAGKRIDRPERPTAAAVWQHELDALRQQPGFSAGPVETGRHAAGSIRRMRYTARIGDEERPARMVLIYDRTQGYGVVLSAHHLEAETDAIDAAFATVLESVVLPDRPEPEVPDAETAPTPTPPAADAATDTTPPEEVANEDEDQAERDANREESTDGSREFESFAD